MELSRNSLVVAFLFGMFIFVYIFPDAIKNRKIMTKKEFIYSVCMSTFFGVIAIFSIYAFFISPKGATMYEALDLAYNRLRK